MTVDTTRLQQLAYAVADAATELADALRGNEEPYTVMKCLVAYRDALDDASAFANGAINAMLDLYASTRS